MESKPFSQDNSQLITDLHALHKKSPKLVKPVQYAAPAIPEITVESWKMNEFKYYDIPSPFPTLARGLFSVREDEAEEKDGRARYRIVTRGYDKFFNIGEVPWTNVRFLPLAHTVAQSLSDPSFLLPVVVSRNSHKTAIHSDAQI
jgi:tRNA ligase